MIIAAIIHCHVSHFFQLGASSQCLYVEHKKTVNKGKRKKQTTWSQLFYLWYELNSERMVLDGSLQ
jgi:hypothetical protein